MSTAKRVFEIEREGEILVLTPTTNLGELADPPREAEEEAIIGLLIETSTKKLIVDFHKTDYFGSSALGFFVRLWKLVQGYQGCMAFCNLSDHEKEILMVCGLDSLWPVCASREQAREAVQGAALATATAEP
jgi:anti-anti-sigma factor